MRRLLLALLLLTIPLATVGMRLQFAPTGECRDRLDNDGDGDIDYPDDASCAQISEEWETGRIYLNPESE